MTNESSGKFALPPEATQSSYERVLEWNNQTAAEPAHLAAFNRRPGSVPNDQHNPEGMESLRDDMALQRHLTDSNDPYYSIGYEQVSQRNRIGQVIAGLGAISSTIIRIHYFPV